MSDLMMFSFAEMMFETSFQNDVVSLTDTNTKKTILQSEWSFSMRVMGLEPIRHKHTPLKRACLPVPAHSLTNINYYSTRFTLCQQLFSIFFKNFSGAFLYETPDIFHHSLVASARRFSRSFLSKLYTLSQK